MFVSKVSRTIIRVKLFTIFIFYKGANSEVKFRAAYTLYEHITRKRHPFIYAVISGYKNTSSGSAVKSLPHQTRITFKRLLCKVHTGSSYIRAYVHITLNLKNRIKTYAEYKVYFLLFLVVLTQNFDNIVNVMYWLSESRY